MAASNFSERRDADALQRAWERYERLLAAGADPDYAVEQASKLLTPGSAPLFAVADAVRVSARPTSMPAFAERMEADLMAARGLLRRPAPRRMISRGRRAAGSTIMAFAACIAILAGVFVASSHSLPGDGLYGLKRASEEMQLAVVWGPTEAHVRISLAQTRINEVQGLFARAHTSVLGAPGSNVAGALDDIDPRIARLIRETLAEAEQQITIAANILIGPRPSGQRADVRALARLVTVAHQGASLAKGVAVTLPSPDKPPVLTTADNLAIVAAKAEAVQQQQTTAAPAQATATPCPSPTATPTPTPTPSASPSSSPTTAKPSESPSASPSSAPSGTRTDPCATATPSPTPTPTPSATPPASPDGKKKSAESSPAAQSGGSADSAAQSGSGDPSSAPGAQPAS